MKERIRAVQGGTSASKTISILLYLIALAQSDTTPTLTSIVSESFPHLRRGAMRDFMNILQEHSYYKDDRWDKTNSIYTFETGSQIEFFSVDQSEKLRGARRDRIFINECNNIAFNAFEELEVRTKDFIILDWNPTNEFWLYTKVCRCGRTECVGDRTDVEHIVLTYKDNEALSSQLVTSIEQRKNRKSWWQVYGLGQLGVVEGRIYSNWQIIDDIPREARLERYGLDFGYTNDPTTIVAIYYYNGGYILDEMCYHKGMSNRQISDLINSLPFGLVIADSAEPKSIDELKYNGVNVQPAEKGRGSISQGIQFVQDQKISVTKRSTNIINEYRNYLWQEDDGKDNESKMGRKPEQGLDHCMDAIRYAFTSFRPYIETPQEEFKLYANDFR